MSRYSPTPGITAARAVACVVVLLVTVLLAHHAVAEVRTNTILPEATADSTGGPGAPHRSYLDPGATRRNQLLVFLPGTGGRNLGPPRPFSQAAAELGYHVIELAYPNDIPATVCWRVPDPSCFEGFRREIITGDDTSPLISLRQSDSIENQLRKVLVMLSQRQPNRGWQQYIDQAGRIAWEKVALAGQSQGGGHAALIARDRRVARVLLFGAPKDYDPHKHRPATWYRPGSTPGDRFFALVHSRDEQGCTFPQQLEIYRKMGLGDKPVSVDSTPAPYGNAHVLITSYPGTTIPSKAAHVVGLTNPRFKQVWTYMLTSGDNVNDQKE